MQHIEFIHRTHFARKYHRRHARKALSYFIDFFWETDFDELFGQHPQGFSDALFPNVGYTYMLNLGTPFVMQLDEKHYPVKKDIFLPRHRPLICHHQVGNWIFGIKFRVSPIVLEKNVNFSEYREAVHPLAYLIDKTLLQAVKNASNFEERVQLLSAYYGRIIDRHANARQPVAIVTEILRECSEQRTFNHAIAELADSRGISGRTLQRYFLATTSIPGKQALQIMRIRTAVELLVARPEDFRFEDFGYYDYSHFFKHMKAFMQSAHLEMHKPHLELLRLHTLFPRVGASPMGK